MRPIHPLTFFSVFFGFFLFFDIQPIRASRTCNQSAHNPRSSRASQKQPARFACAHTPAPWCVVRGPWFVFAFVSACGFAREREKREEEERERERARARREKRAEREKRERARPGARECRRCPPSADASIGQEPAQETLRKSEAASPRIPPGKTPLEC